MSMSRQPARPQQASSRAAAKPRSTAPVAPALPDDRALLSLFDTTIPRVPVSLGYRLALLVVAVTNLLLPLLYLGVIVLAAYGIYWYAINATVIFEGGPRTGRSSGRVGLFKVFIYLAPMVIGGILVLFMIKPLFARRSDDSEPMELNQLDQPLLYNFVRRLCNLVGAPEPARIHVDTNVNAAASFDGGVWGMLSGRLVLTLGLPLAAGTDLRQFTGVLAHELGHFAQGGAMRLTWIIRSVSNWFARVVYQRDAWDDYLVQMAADGGHWGIQLTALLAQFFVWLTRQVLRGLMLIGQMVSLLMLRQMEFDADRYEARVAGSKAFEQTVHRLTALNLAMEAALNELGGAWREKRLCDDLPTLVTDREREIPPDARKEIAKAIMATRTGWLDSHPADADRIRSAANENAPGLIPYDAPATILFQDFTDLSRQATLRFYRGILGNQVKSDHLVSTSTLATTRTKRRESHNSLQRFFRGLIDPRRPVFPGGMPVPLPSADAAGEGILESRSAFVQTCDAVRPATERFEKADERLGLVMGVKAMRAGGIARIPVSDAQLARAGDADLRAHERAARLEIESANSALRPVLEHGLRRLALALALDATNQPKQAAAADDGDLYDIADSTEPAGSVASLLAALTAMQSPMAIMEKMRVELTELSALLSQCKEENNDEHLVSAVLQRSRHIAQHLMEVHGQLRRLPYPYEHTERGATLAGYIIEHPPAADQVGDVFNAAESAINAMYSLYMRLMADLASKAEQVEETLGLPRLEAPPEPKDPAEAMESAAG